MCRESLKYSNFVRRKKSYCNLLVFNVWANPFEVNANPSTPRYGVQDKLTRMGQVKTKYIAACGGS